MTIPSRPKPPLTHEELSTICAELAAGSPEIRRPALQKLWGATSETFICSDDAVRIVADPLLKVFESDSDPEIRLLALQILHYKLPPTRQLATAFIAAINDADQTLRSRGAELPPLDVRFIAELRAGAQHDDPLVRRMFISSVSAGPQDPLFTELLISALSDSDEIVRCNAVYSLGMLESRIVLAEPGLISVLQDTKQIRFLAAKALRKLRPDCAEANRTFDELVQADLKSSDSNAQSTALRELNFSFEVDAGYTELLRPLLDTSQCSQAANAIAKIGPAAKDEIPHLKRVLTASSDGRVDVAVAMALAALEAHDEEIFDVLEKAYLLDGCDDSMRDAAKALACFGKAGVPSLVKGLKWDNHKLPYSILVRQDWSVARHDEAAVYLARMGRDAIAAVPALLQIVHEGGGQPLRSSNLDKKGSSSVLWALVRIAPDDARVVACLSALATDESDYRSEAARDVLATIDRECRLLEMRLNHKQAKMIRFLIEHECFNLATYQDFNGGRKSAAAQDLESLVTRGILVRHRDGFDAVYRLTADVRAALIDSTHPATTA